MLCGAQSLVHFSALTWLPSQIAGQGPRAVSLALLAMSLGGVAATVALAALARGYARSPLLHVTAGAVAAAGVAGLLADPAGPVWAFGAMVGAGCSAVFVAGMALPALLCRSTREAASTAGVMLARAI